MAQRVHTWLQAAKAFVDHRLGFLTDTGALEYHQRLYDVHGDEGLRNIVLQEHTGMGVVAGLLATVTVQALFTSLPQEHSENAYNYEAKYVYLVMLLLATWFNLSAISISFEVYANLVKLPPNTVFKFVCAVKGKARMEGFLQLYLGAYSLWGAVCAAQYVMNGPLAFFLALGFGVVFMVHVTALTNHIFDALLDCYTCYHRGGNQQGGAAGAAAGGTGADDQAGGSSGGDGGGGRTAGPRFIKHNSVAPQLLPLLQQEQGEGGVGEGSESRPVRAAAGGLD